MPDTPTAPGTTPRTVQEDTPMTTPTTPAPVTLPVPASGQRWWYWVVYISPDGGTNGGEISQPEPITRGAQVIECQEAIAGHTGHPKVLITFWALLRVEDADGQVIG